MKFRVTLKDPDKFEDALKDAVKESIGSIPDLDEDEQDALFNARTDKFHSAVGKWFKYGEYLTVELDTETGTAVVVETP